MVTLEYSWSAILLWVYTGEIVFADIHIQGAHSSGSKEIQGGCSPDNGRDPPQDLKAPKGPPLSAVVVEPCSPKSIYHLTDRVRPTRSLGYAVADPSFRLDWHDHSWRYCLRGHPVQVK